MFGRTLLAACVLLGLVAGTSGNYSSVEQGWRQLEKGAKYVMKLISRQIASPAIKNLYRTNVSQECINSLLRISQGMLALQRWALVYLDATGKLPEGSLGGTYTNVGSYELCKSLATTVRGKILFRGQYCSLRLRPPLPPEPDDFRRYPALVPLPELANFSTCDNVVCELARVAQASYFSQPTFGVCLPDTCSVADVRGLVDALKAFLQMEPLDIEVNSCRTSYTRVDWNLWQICVTSLLAFMAVLLVLCSLLDIFLPVFCPAFLDDKSNKPLKLVRCFSLYTNTKELLRTDNLSHPKLKFFHGIRLLSFCWVALGHSYLVFGGIVPIRNMLKGFEFLANPLFQCVHNAILSVDTFFYLSGFLLTYLHSREMRLVEYPRLFLKSYLKLMIPTGFTLMLTHVMPLTVDNPNVDRVNLLISSCATNWWRVILMIGNLFPLSVKRTCLFQLWFIMVQVQLFLPGLVMLAILHRYRKQGVLMLLALIAIGAVSSMLITVMADYDPAPPIQSFNVVYWFEIFANPILHIAPFFAGMLMGHLLIHDHIGPLRMYHLFLGWTMCTACGMFSIYTPYLWVGDLVAAEHIWTAKVIYALLNRTCWAAMLSWVTLACFKDMGGLVQEFLSWEGFLPLSRLSFAAFFTHSQVFHLIGGNLTVELEICHTMCICLFFAVLFVNFGYAYVFQMTLVFPMEKLFRLKTPPRQDPPTTDGPKENIPRLQVQLKSCKYLVNNS